MANELEELYQRLKEGPHDKMTFVINKRVADPERTVSFEAVDMASKQVVTFIMARLSAYYDRTGRGPQDVEINFDLKFDGDIQPSTEEDKVGVVNIGPTSLFTDGFHRSE